MTTAAAELDAIEGLAAGATPGPWVFEGDERNGCGVFDEGTGELFVFSPDPQSTGDFRADLAFIAHARTDVPAMAKALRAVLALVANVGNESTGPEFVACYEIQAAITAALSASEAGK